MAADGPPGRIEVKVHPKARQNKVEATGAASYSAWTTAPPDKGRANEAVARLLAEHFGVALGRVRLVQGATSRRKVFEVE